MIGRDWFVGEPPLWEIRVTEGAAPDAPQRRGEGWTVTYGCPADAPPRGEERAAWACPYCRTLHPHSRLSCPNCGAPRPAP